MHRLVHQPHRPVVAMGDHSHAVGHLGAAQTREKKGAVEVVCDCAVHRHGQRAQGGPRGQYAHQESLSDAQFSVDVSSSGENENTNRF